MRWLFLLFFFTVSLSQAQVRDALGKEYIKGGEYEKAVVVYKKLYDKRPTNSYYISQLAKCYQELEKYDEAEALFKQRLKKSTYIPVLVDLTQNYLLKKDTINANLTFKDLLKNLEEKPNYTGTAGSRLEAYGLFDKAIATYKIAMEINPDANYNLQLAGIYGAQGNIEKMFSSYLDFGIKQKPYRERLKRNIGDFISDNGDDENNSLLRKLLLKRIQSQPDLYWTDMLSWLYIQQKEYNKAFAQEKGLFKRDPNKDVTRLMDLANIAKNEKAYLKAIEIYEYVLEQTDETELTLYANQIVLEIKTQLAEQKDYKTIENSYQELMDRFGNTPQTVSFVKSYAHFLAFYNNNTGKAISLLKNTLDLKINARKKAEVKIELADILVFEQRFNEALIYYTQVQRNLKSSKLAQIARFKVAKTSYYKGDFTWAESQLKILKSSTSQLTANDAMDLQLLISDNRQEDSLQVALTQYAKADLLAFQNKTQEAVSLLEKMKVTHKTKSIIPQVLLKQAQLLEKQKQYAKAKTNYQFLIKNFTESILKDDAIFALALLDLEQFNLTKEAKKGFESIIFNHADSIYFTEARKRFRLLRGDDLK